MIPVQVRVNRKLLEKIDRAVIDGNYQNRSELIRDALRSHLVSFSDDEKKDN